MHEQNHANNETDNADHKRDINADIRKIAEGIQKYALENPYLTIKSMDNIAIENTTQIQVGNRRFYCIILTVSPDDEETGYFWHCSISIGFSYGSKSIKKMLWTDKNKKIAKKLIEDFLTNVGYGSITYKGFNLALHGTKELNSKELIKI